MTAELTTKVNQLRQTFEILQQTASLSDIAEQLSSTATQIAELPAQLQQIRQSGYAYANYLEKKVETLGGQWHDVYLRIVETVDTELVRAQQEMQELDEMWERIDAAMAGSAGETTQKIITDKEKEAVKTAAAFGAAVKRVKLPEPKSLAGLTAAGGKKDIPKPILVGALASGEKPAQTGGMTNAMAGALGGAKSPSTTSGGLAGTMGASLAGPAQLEALAGQIESAMGRLNQSLAVSKERITVLYGAVPDNVSQTQRQLDEIKRYLELSQQASFLWNAGEDVFMVVEAEWKKAGKDKEDPNGYFYISNQRLVMEQKEKVGAGFLGRGGENVHEKIWEAPIASLKSVRAEKKGMLGGIDLIHIEFGSGGPFGETTIEVKGGIDAKFFANKLKLVISGDVEKERGQTPRQAEVEALKDAPTICPTCGATFDQPVTRGLMQLTCAYCGSIVRLG